VYDYTRWGCVALCVCRGVQLWQHPRKGQNMNQLFDGITVVTGTHNVVVSALVFEDTLLSCGPWHETLAFAHKYVELETGEPVALFKRMFIQSMADRGLTIFSNEGGE
jgi:hypothetical protein